MRFACLFAVLVPLSAAVVSDVRYKISAGDLTSADAIADEFCRTNGSNSECAAAVSWLARGALMMKEYDSAARYLKLSRSITSNLLKSLRVDDDAFLATAVGAEIEVESRALAAQGKHDQAIALLQSELPKWNLYAIHARIQKNLNMLTLEGKPALGLDPADRGKPVLLFLWGHWCGDCTAQAPILARIQQRYQSRGLVVRAPTRRVGVAKGNDSPTPEQEDADRERVWKESYGGLTGVPHDVDEATMLAYGVSSTPTFVLIDRRGIVRMYRPFRMSEPELARHIDAVLAMK